MKIKKASSKKLTPLPRQLSDLIKQLETGPEEKIPSLVQQLIHWPYSRGDLFYWVAVLDRFDDILARICKVEYNLTEFQTRPFDDQTKQLIMSILDLSRTLFENCTNRNIYNSYEYLCYLFNTFDLDILQNVLHFMLRPAQRVHNPRAIRSSFSIPEQKVFEMARGWNHVQQAANLLRIQSTDLEVTPTMSTINLQFYRSSTATITSSTAAISASNSNINESTKDDSNDSNDSTNTQNEGLQVIHLNLSNDDLQKSDFELFTELRKKYEIPKDNEFELLNRIRIAKYVHQPDKRRQLLGIRLLSFANMCYITTETTIQNKVLIYEPYLIQQIGELIVPEKNVDVAIQTFALYALEGIVRHRGKLADVLTAVNASANHGTLMQILRKISNQSREQLKQQESTSLLYQQYFLDSLFSFLSYLLQTQPGGQMLMSAGIIPITVQIVANSQYMQIKNIAKVVGLIDTLVNGFTSSFSAFCNVNGLDILLTRIKVETETVKDSVKMEEINDGIVPHDRISAIKAMLKFLLRMMEASGTADGLRNLIDSTLPHSLRIIMENPKIFGNSIFALATNVTTTFIHNEPTSLPILQEAKLPQSFLQTISTYEQPNNEVMMAAVNAFGAMCLNAQGLDMFNTIQPLTHFFDLMTAPDFIRNPIDLDSSTALGSTLDELIRHHPSLKPNIFKCVTAMIKKVIDMGNDMQGIGKPKDDKHLIQVRTLSNSTETTMQDTNEENVKDEKVDCLLVTFIDLVSRFLEGLFQNQSNIKDFVEEGCPELLLSYYTLPLLPANFTMDVAHDSLSYLFRMISEVSPLPTVMAIAAKMKDSIRFLTDKGDNYPSESILKEFVDVQEGETDKYERGNDFLRHLIVLHGYTALFSNICCSSPVTHGKNGASLLIEFLAEDKDDNIILLLAQLCRAVSWESILLKHSVPFSWYRAKASSYVYSGLKKGPGVFDRPLGISSSNNDNEDATVSLRDNAENDVQNESAEPSSTNESGENENDIISQETTEESLEAKASTSTTADTTKKVPPANDPRMINLRHFKALLSDVQTVIMPVFHSLLKTSVSRRAGATLSKAQTMKLAEYMTEILKTNFTWPPVERQATAARYDYLKGAYDMASTLLRDERSQTSLQTPLAVVFERQGGVDLLLEQFKQHWTSVLSLQSEIEALSDPNQKTEKRELILLKNDINDAIESLLKVLLAISSPKSLRESTYTTTLTQRDKNAADYFDPYEWIIGLELKLMALQDYLKDPQLKSFSKNTSQLLIKLFIQIMKGEGSLVGPLLSNTPGHLGSNRSGTVDPFGLGGPLMSSTFNLVRQPIVVAERNIQTLVDMGFERRSAEQALMRCNNQVSRAVDYLFSHPTPVISSTPSTRNTGASTSVQTDNDNIVDDRHSQQNADESNPNNNEATEGNGEGNDESNEDRVNEDEDEDDDNHHDQDEDNDFADQPLSSEMEDVIGSFVESLNNSRMRQLTDSLGFNSHVESSGGSETNERVSENVKKLKTIRRELSDSLPSPLLDLADAREDLLFDVRDLLVVLCKHEDASNNNSESNSDKDNKAQDFISVKIVTMLMDKICQVCHDTSKSVLVSRRFRLLALLLRESPIQNIMEQLRHRFASLFGMFDAFANSFNNPDEPLPAWTATLFLVLEAFIAQTDEPRKAKLNNHSQSSMFVSSDDEEGSSQFEDANGHDDNESEADDPMEDVEATTPDATAAIRGSESAATNVEEATAEQDGNVTPEHRTKFLEICVTLLRKRNLSRDDIYAILRMVVRLTKDYDSALRFVELGGVPLLFAKPRSGLEGLQGQQAFIILILRHIVESKAVLQSIMKDIITNWFTNPRPRFMDMNSFVRSNAHVALRAPSVFVNVTTDICRLVRYVNYEVNRQIKLRKQDKDEKATSISETDNGGNSGTNSMEATQAKPSSPSEKVVYYLLNEVMTVRSEVIALNKKSTLTDEEKKQENNKFVYTGFLLQCLVELISSYPSCKYDVFNFCKKENGQRTTTPDGKHRPFVSMLINDLLPVNQTLPITDEMRKQHGLARWTASTLVAMTFETSSNELTAQQKSELLQVRKYVLEAIIRSLKEAIASNETASIKYSKYACLADLCHRMLNARPSSGPTLPRSMGGTGTQTNSKESNFEDGIMSNAKIMLDKNFVAVLTSAISDVDINYPHAKLIINNMLRPLEQLTKLAIKPEGAIESDEEGQDKMDTSEETVQMPSTSAADDDEGAPDLYRNSALGMYGAGSVLDEDEYDSGDYTDMFGSSVEEEEDYDEESSSDLSDMSEGDEENGEEEMEAILHEHSYDEDDMDEDENDPSDIDAEAQFIDEENEEDEDEDDEVDREMTWHLEDIDEDPAIIHAEAVIDTTDDNQDVRRTLSEIFDEEEDMDALSEFDEASDNMENESDNEEADGVILDPEDLEATFPPLESEELLMLEDPMERSRTIIPAGFRRRFPHSRHSLLESAVGRPFGAIRNAGQEDIITHPLLSNNASNQVSGRNANNQVFHETLFDRFRSTFGSWEELDEFLGGSAIRLLDDFLARAPSSVRRAQIRGIEIGTEGGPMRALLEPPQPLVSHTHSDTAGSDTANNQQLQESLAVLQNFQPMSSCERWGQEARMMYGSNFNDKALKLVNELLNILAPIALEDEQKARAEEEKKRQEQRRKDEEERQKAEQEKRLAEKERKSAEAEAAANAVAESSSTAENANNTAENNTTTEGTTDEADTERTTVTVHGETIDISGTGIDVEFLEALPDDLREEVINQHMQNRPTQAQPTDDDSISPEFLEALPPDIREEVLHQEALERERRERLQRLVTNLPSATGDETDDSTNGRRTSVNAKDKTYNQKKKSKFRRGDAAAQLIDKSQLGALVRLLFIPQSISKTSLNRLLLNLCENGKTRSDLLSYLVCVLYDGNNDLASVDSSFSLLSNGKSVKAHQPKSSKHTTPPVSMNNAPNFIAQRCLEALTYIVISNEQSLTYFLTESEALISLRRSSTSKKGKSKEKIPHTWNKYPILVLMSLLDRPVFINNSGLMEQLMDLLSKMCRPFPLLVKKYQEKLENKQKDLEAVEQKMPKPPTIPEYYLKLVVHVLTNGECSSKTFQSTLNAISHLSALDGALKTIVTELMEDAKQSGAEILKDLQNLLEVLDTTMAGTEVNPTLLAPFSAATSYQAKLLRVLKTLDYMFSRKPTALKETAQGKAEAESQQADNEKRLLEIYEQLNFVPLWKTLGKCLAIIREKEEMINVATVLLPLIESFMVISKCAAERGQNVEKAGNQAADLKPSASEAPGETFFFEFTERHKKVLNIMVRNNPSLMSGSFALLVRNPKMLEFDNKRNYFVQQLHKRTAPRENFGMLQLNVRRQYVFEDSYHQLQGRSGDEIKYGKLAVRFYDEEGVDAGGVTREWFSVLARQMFDPNYALFITSAADKLTYQPNRDSAVNPDHLSFFKFVGRVIGKAIYDGRLLDAYFTRSFYKHILGRTVDYKDVEALDPEYYKSLVWMLENDITDIIEQTFSIETDFFGNKEIVDLKPDGRNIPVTEANKHEYVTLVSEQKLTTAIKDQINAFVQGFHDIIPAHLIQIFNEQELELLISGLPDIDIDEWKNNTEYQGYTASSPQIQWFWRAVRSFDQEERAKLLQFATGTSKVPLEGFSQLQGSGGVQKFQIHKDFGGENRLPSAHTCFNQIDLPQYDSYESLRANLFKAINECSTGFALV
ncbi:hypothetical protein BDF20DRAFT_908845 [Mycotypha africana]|uniref:uncharacterized protein n=1 Tax=Mycotypha africana TaxID=64632 RepID=UPI0022FFE92B|nr:uncharacterized protein BDF20DRAFT_908845 [Mycotypha africana]KAI8991027.1 hypothetical protein BDF20DRAFT_908845 [Mycotypha africana]